MIPTNQKAQIVEFLNLGNSYLKIPITLSLWRKIQLLFAGNAKKGIELYGMGPIELVRGFYLFGYREYINLALSKDYRVLILRDMDSYFSAEWYLVFEKKTV
jgi:hypothetical protein